MSSAADLMHVEKELKVLIFLLQDNQQNQVVMSKTNNIIGMDDDEFPSEDECVSLVSFKDSYFHLGVLG